MLFPALGKYSGWLEAEACSKVKVTVTVVEAVLAALVPMPLVIKSKGIEEITCKAHECHLSGKVGGQEGFLALDGVGETMAITDARGKGDVV